ncbi:MAG: CPBP family intramembrane glutamic endopeptidase [Myxococcota bacterium]
MSVAALLWAYAQGRSALAHPEPWWSLPAVEATAVSLALGLVLGLGVVAATRELVHRTAWAAELHVSFRAILGPLTGRRIAFLAATSGIGEELFFRGAMQPVLGLPLTALVFGLLHVGPSRSFLPWTAWAILMGLGFGAVFSASGSLAGCVLAHVLINHENLHFIDAYDPRPHASAHRLGPALVAQRLRSGGTARSR